MKALTWHGKRDVRVEEVRDPRILDPEDAIVEVTASAICGSDLHIYHGHILAMHEGDVLGHEFAGRIVAVGSGVERVKLGDRVVIPFTISCGQCEFCTQGKFSLCVRTNPDALLEKKVTGYPTAGLFGYSHMYGGYWGGQAELVRVPYADVSALVLPEGISEEHALFLSDIFPTGFMAAENCNIKEGDAVAVWGCGPVGQFAIRSAIMLGASKVIAIDRFQDRLDMAADAGAIVIDYMKENVVERLKEMTDGLGPHSCIDAVGLESHGHSVDAILDEVLQRVGLETDRPHALRQAIKACRNGGTISIPGVYTGILDNFPLGVAFAKGLTFKMGQTHVQKYMQPLLELIELDVIDPRFVITNRITMDEVPDAYDHFSKKESGCIKYVINPQRKAA